MSREEKMKKFSFYGGRNHERHERHENLLSDEGCSGRRMVLKYKGRDRAGTRRGYSIDL